MHLAFSERFTIRIGIATIIDARLREWSEKIDDKAKSGVSERRKFYQ